jgi:ABC-2 type transport system ATP-binding protein
MLQLEGIRKRFGDRLVLDDVSLACEPGEAVVVIGGNGSGKSTLLKIAAGLLEPSAGRIRLRGEPVVPGAVPGRRHLGYLADNADLLPDLSVAELAELAAALKRVDPAPFVAAWRERLGLGPPVFRQRLRALSFGQRKRALLLTALIGDPWLLILDEPSNGIDPEGCVMLAALVDERRRRAQGTLIASNDAAFIQAVAGRTLRVAGGKLRQSNSEIAS